MTLFHAPQSADVVELPDGSKCTREAIFEEAQRLRRQELRRIGKAVAHFFGHEWHLPHLFHPSRV